MTLSTGNTNDTLGDYSLHSAERQALIRALKELKGNPMAKVAERLGITRYTLNRLIITHGLQDEIYRSWPRVYDWITGKHSKK